MFIRKLVPRRGINLLLMTKQNNIIFPKQNMIMNWPWLELLLPCTLFTWSQKKYIIEIDKFKFCHQSINYPLLLSLCHKIHWLPWNSPDISLKMDGLAPEDEFSGRREVAEPGALLSVHHMYKLLHHRFYWEDVLQHQTSA